MQEEITMTVTTPKTLPQANSVETAIGSTLSEEFPHQLLPRLAELRIMGLPYHGYGCPGKSTVLDGNGILLDQQLGRFVAGAEAIYSYEGTREMNTLIVGRAITGFSAFV